MKNKRLIILAMALFPAALMAQGLDLTPAQQSLVDEIPTDTAARAREIFAVLDKDADTLVPMFASRLTTQKSDADTTARYALGGLVWTSGHSGTPEQKAKLAELIAGAIAKTEGVEPKSFLIEQLQFLGQDSIAPTLYPLMTDKELGPRAIRTLAALKPEGLDGKMTAALDDAGTTEIKAGLLLTLAKLAPKDAVAKVTEFASDSDPDVKQAALDALAAIGDPSSREALQKAASRSTTFYDELGPARYLAYAEKLAANGNEKLGAEICREIASAKHTPENEYLTGLALYTLTDIENEKALDDLFAHVNDDPEDVRASVLRDINRFKTPEVTRRLTDALEKAPDPEVTEAILLALGDRKDVAALPAVESKFGDTSATIAALAVASAGEIDNAKAMPAMLNVLKNDSDKVVIDAIVNQLRRVKTELLLPAVAEAVATSNPSGQAALIGLLGERRASSQKEVVYAATKSDVPAVRSAAYDALGRVAEASDLPRLRDLMLSAEKKNDRTAARKAFVAAAKDSQDAGGLGALLKESFDQADEKGKVTLLEAMAAIAEKDTLDIVQEAAVKGSPEDVQEAAVRALADWQSQDAVPALSNVAKTSKDVKQKVLAVRGLARLAGELPKQSVEQLELFKTALSLAKRPDEQKAIISQIADIRTTDALKAIGPYVTREDVKAEAVAAALKIAMPTDKKPGIEGADAIEILQNCLPALSDDERKPVEKYIYSLIRLVYSGELPVDSEGFAVLFNGKDLSGWCGDTHGYYVENGALVCSPDIGGRIFTDREFGDYVLRFDFKLPAGANNGVGIRAPISGDTAYSGMEIQILDNNAPAYKDIKEWQRHGSVYGVHAAQPSQLKIDEWNTEEISVIARNIKVTLNGKVINECNLDEAKAKGYPSSKEHPGADRNRGHIGFLGHGHKVEFRNIRLKNVANNAPPEGFTSLFNGEDLKGWKGLVANPIKRKEMSEDKLKKAQDKADQNMNEHWSIENGILFFDGLGSHLCTTKDYGNFEMKVDWCIPPGGDNGVYLRGSPQVQIWDPHYWPQGSGGLYNNQKNTSDPLVLADNPIGQWNHFDIKMVNDKVTVKLNDKLVVDNVTLDNYWDRKLPIFPKEQIELQSHGSPAWWRNVYVKELP